MAYTLNEVPINKSVGFLMEFVKLLLKFTYKSKGPREVNTQVGTLALLEVRL